MTATSPTISIPARPTPLPLDLTQTAVIVIDMQNDFGASDGVFARAGVDVSGIQQTIAPTVRVIAGARAAGVTIIYTKGEMRRNLADIGAPNSKTWARVMGMGDMPLVENSRGAAIVDELTPQDSDVIISKHRFSAFYGTDLDIVLRSLGVKYLVVTGCTTSICVESTVRDAMFRDYNCLVLADCTAEPIGEEFPRTNRDASLLLIERIFGWVSESTEFLEALEAPAVPAR